MELNRNNYAHTSCQAGTSEILQKWLMIYIKLKLSAWFEGDADKTKDAMRMLLLVLFQLLLLCHVRVLR